MGKSEHRQIRVFSSELRRIHQSIPELKSNSAVFEVHRLGQEVDPDRRLHHARGEQIAAARIIIIRSDFAGRFQ